MCWPATDWLVSPDGTVFTVTFCDDPLAPPAPADLDTEPASDLAGVKPRLRLSSRRWSAGPANGLRDRRRVRSGRLDGAGSSQSPIHFALATRTTSAANPDLDVADRKARDVDDAFGIATAADQRSWRSMPVA
jgi:hypothetical protein